MYLRFKTIALSFALCAAPSAVYGQLAVGGRTVNFHGFLQQGYAVSNQNNFLTMKTSEGSFAMTDGALNVSSQLTDKFRVGAQVYSRNIGELSNGRVEIDWAFGDYRVRDWFGVRVGKVKTALGLYSDTQDAEFLHTWALLPQSVYPLDLRASTIAHVGADMYGEVPLKKFGSLAYTVYGGVVPDDPRGGYRYSLRAASMPLDTNESRMIGTDARWKTPVEGLTAGFSFVDSRATASGKVMPFNIPFNVEVSPNHIYSWYGEYTLGGLRLNGEFRRNTYTVDVTGMVVPPIDAQGWFASGAYRFSKWLEVGTYHSRFFPNQDLGTKAPEQHIYDQAVTARVDFTRNWNVKVEGHFMDGYGDGITPRGFYPSLHPAGLQQKTNLLVVRTGFNF